MPIVALIAGAIFPAVVGRATSSRHCGHRHLRHHPQETKPFAGDPGPFVMELPPYHLPTVKNVLRGTWERGWSFHQKAGTIITLSSVFVWFTSSFGFVDGVFGMVEDMDASILADIGNAVCFIFAPRLWQLAGDGRDPARSGCEGGSRRYVRHLVRGRGRRVGDG